MKKGFIAAVIAMLAAAVWSCGSGRRSEPIVGPALATANSSLHEGEQLFMEYCNQCHPGGDAGLGPALNNKPVPGAAVRLQVRQGLGAMPKFPEHMISSRELDQILDYMSAKRKAG